MSFEYEEKILDAGLDEVLGGHYPPDLTSKILQRWEAEQLHRNGRAQRALASISEPLAPPIQEVARPLNRRLELPRIASQRVLARRRYSLSQLAAAATVSLLGVAVAMLITIVANNQRFDTFDIAEQSHPLSAERSGQNHALGERNRQENSPNNTAKAGKRAPQPRKALAASSGTGIAAQRSESGNANDRTQADRSARQFDIESAIAPLPPVVARDNSEVIKFVNDAIRMAWQEHGIDPAEPATDEQWCERVFSRLVGRAPSQEELESFLDSQGAEKREELVDRLLASDEFARHWAEIWTEVLVGGTTRPRNSSFARREGLQHFLYQSIVDEKSHAEIATQLITASGSNDPASDNFNPAVNFLLAGTANNVAWGASQTSRVFLGKQLHCVQCHDHPANSWRQSDYWGLNAFFRQMRVRHDSVTGAAAIVNVDFHGESGAGKDAEVFYESPNGRMRIAYPRFRGQELPHSGLIADFHRREALAMLVVNSPEFARATVNRIWAELTGFGFTQPVDDMGPHNDESHPELLASLADEFRARNFEMRAAIRWIALSEPFGLSAAPPAKGSEDQPELGGTPLFARFYEPKKTLIGELPRTLTIAADSRSQDIRLVPGIQASRAFSNPGAISLEIAAEPPQPLASAEPYREFRNGWLEILAKSDMSQRLKIEHLFSAALGRAPNSREMTAAKLVMADRRDDVIAVYDIWTALLNTDR